jgi:serine/threonine protein phosphatase PrpC
MMKLNHFSKSVIGLVRKANEDSIGSLTNNQTNGNGDIFVVCDGMGGHVGGATASQTAIKCILQYFEQEVNPNPIIALEKAISFANQQIFGLAQQDPSLKGMGTTCTVLLCKKDKIYIAHVGDSRIYINTDNKLYRITKDHSFVQKLVDAGQLEDSEMETHPRKNELTKALGIAANVEVEVAENPILPKSGDKFLMCSDGLCGLVNDLTIANTINNTVGLDAVNELIQLAENAGGNDNISVDIIDIIQSPHSKTIFKDQGNKSFTATQVLDIPTKKGDMKLLTIFKKYQVYILSSLLILLLGMGYFTYEVIKGNITFNNIDISEEEPIAAPLDTNENFVQDPDSVRGVEVKKENTESNTIEVEVLKKDGSVPFSKTQEEYEQEERERRVKESQRLDKEKTKISLLKKARNKIKEMREKMKSKPNKYHNSHKYNMLIEELKRLEKQTKNQVTSLIERQIEKVDESLSGLEDYINNKELNDARENARNQISTLLQDVSINAKISMKTEIQALKGALKGTDTSFIQQCAEALTDKVTAVRTEIDKNKNSIVPDSVKTNTPPKE